MITKYPSMRDSLVLIYFNKVGLEQLRNLAASLTESKECSKINLSIEYTKIDTPLAFLIFEQAKLEWAFPKKPLSLLDKLTPNIGLFFPLKECLLLKIYSKNFYKIYMEVSNKVKDFENNIK